jgi:hypothetical protein
VLAFEKATLRPILRHFGPIFQEIICLVRPDRNPEIANNITGDIQQLCEVLWEDIPEGDAVSSDKLKTALELIFAREQKSYEAFVSLLTDFQIKCLRALAEEGGRRVYSMDFVKAVGHQSSASVNRAMTRMININILFKSGKEIRFVNPFFKAWLLPRGL